MGGQRGEAGGVRMSAVDFPIIDHQPSSRARNILLHDLSAKFSTSCL